MKTESEVQSQIDSLRAQFAGVNPESPLHKSSYKKAQKSIEFLSTCLNYIKEHPSENYLLTQLTNVRNRIAQYESGYECWLENTPQPLRGDNPVATYKKETGLGILKLQVRHLEFILS